MESSRFVFFENKAPPCLCVELVLREEIGIGWNFGIEERAKRQIAKTKANSISKTVAIFVRKEIARSHL